MFSLADLAERLGARLVGEGACRVSRVATLTSAGEGDIAFITHKRYRNQLADTCATAVLLSEADLGFVRDGVHSLVVGDPYLAYARVARWLNPEPDEGHGVHPSVVVDPTADIHASAWIGPQCVIEAGVVIGADCRIGPGCVVGRDAVIGEGGRLVANVTICHGSLIGKRVLMHPGVVIGADGFGLANDQGHWVKIPQLGRVLIGDDVDIGANTTIDRGAIEDTVIEDGVKLDNLVQVAHNVRIGAHSAIAGCSGIAGSARIGKHCALGGGVGIVGHLQIADNVTVTGMSMVSHTITEAGVYSSGTPLQENAKWHRNYVRFKQLDDMARRLKRLEKQLEAKNTE
ncbi:UDP-3-O-[3-hydroxymyristoyl] glucosamine N-acyltransferase [hydrothermal vent metagenome]|uniref:UDP-3-O-[3-hydroxymyristoyl] glucosamine N-acyltransferase n=1 Tax=hydrothermal vent metagenome TaxID=652676 RepID=A0A3B1A162_9ZZZZ